MEELKLFVDYGVIGILFFMSFLSLAFSIERYIYYKNVNLRSYPHKTSLEIALSNNLSIIATIASNAPYVGLLGTVLGIMFTFFAIGKEGLSDTNALMTGLALALKATALGLLVAIPSIVFYNGLVRKMEVLIATWEVMHDQNSPTAR